MTFPIHELPLDEHDLAALLAGTLADAERQRVLARLASDPEARILLQMAIEAMETVQAPEIPMSGPRSGPTGGRRAA